MGQIVLAFILGACIASFLNLVADRLPFHKSIVKPGSHCPNCGRELTPLELIPIVSYAALRGRCHACKAKIPFRSALVETALGVLAAYLVAREGFSLPALVLFSYVSFFLLLALIDLDHSILPFALTFPALGITALLSPFWNQLGLERSFMGSTGYVPVFLGSLLGAFLFAGLLFLILFIRPDAMGGGDPPLAAIIGFVMGFPGTLVAFLMTAVSGGIVGILLLALRRRGRKDSIPYGPYLSLGGALALLWGPGIWAWYIGLLTGGR